jgi:hypothetical protein
MTIEKLNTYRKILKHFGFERIKGKDSVKGRPSFTQEKYNWYAEIIDYNYFKACWVVGDGLPHYSYTGGKHCDDPQTLLEVLTKGVLKLNE